MTRLNAEERINLRIDLRAPNLRGLRRVGPPTFEPSVDARIPQSVWHPPTLKASELGCAFRNAARVEDGRVAIAHEESNTRTAQFQGSTCMVVQGVLHLVFSCKESYHPTLSLAKE